MRLCKCVRVCKQLNNSARACVRVCVCVCVCGGGCLCCDHSPVMAMCGLPLASAMPIIL